MSISLKRKITPYLYLVPALVLMLSFTYFPFLKTIGTSFFLTNATGRPVEFVGLENYRKTISDPIFRESIINTVLYTFVQVPLTITLSFIMAMAANKKRKASGIYEILFSFSMAVSMAVAAVIFRLMLNPQIGIVNYILGTKSTWFYGEKTAMLSMIMLGVWLAIGMDFLFLLAAVRTVSRDITEAATIDGCSSFVRVVKIYIPLTSPTIFYLLCTNLAASMMMSGPVIILTQGGPNNKTSTIIYYMYTKAFSIYNYGASYSAAVIGFIFAFILILLSFRFEKKGVHYN